MESHNAVGWFEIPVIDMDRAQKFYEGLLGVSLSRQPEMDGMLMSWFNWDPNARGAAGSLVKHSMYKPAVQGGVVVYFMTKDIDDTLSRVESLGGKILWPKKDIGEYGFVAGIVDTEGNHVALHASK